MSSVKNTIKRKLPTLFSLLSKGKQTFLNVLINNQKKSLQKKIESYYENNPETREIVTFLKSNPVEMIPYFYIQEYKNKEITVIDDGFFNVAKINGNDIYFPREMSKKYVVDSVRVGLMEQDKRSPHKYLPTETIDIQGDVAVLCGASDCLYALQIVNSFKKIYLFEANPAWINPIKKTLHNYLHKIEIVPYFISNENDSGSVTLDSFFKTKGIEEVNYIQADIEGNEFKMLEGAKELLGRSGNIKLSLCCYHTPHQQEELTKWLNRYGFTVQSSMGFLLMWMEYPLRPPYLRRGVLYAKK